MTWLDTIGSVLTTGTDHLLCLARMTSAALRRSFYRQGKYGEVCRSERVAGALCTWAAYDIYRRWNGPTQVIPGHVQSEMRLAKYLKIHPVSNRNPPFCRRTTLQGAMLRRAWSTEESHRAPSCLASRHFSKMAAAGTQPQSQSTMATSGVL